jgi:hypothetical protein
MKMMTAAEPQGNGSRHFVSRLAEGVPLDSDGASGGSGKTALTAIPCRTSFAVWDDTVSRPWRSAGSTTMASGGWQVNVYIEYSQMLPSSFTRFRPSSV